MAHPGLFYTLIRFLTLLQHAETHSSVRVSAQEGEFSQGEEAPVEVRIQFASRNIGLVLHTLGSAGRKERQSDMYREERD